MTAPALAAALEVSVRTIMRDVDQLSAAGVPLWSDRGRTGGFQLRAGWSTQLTGLTEPEANALFLSGMPGPATELGLGAAAASARLKLTASLPPEWREQADRVGTRLHVDSVGWYRTQETPVYLRELADAVWNSYRVDIQYESWNGVVSRELDPLGLILKGGAWYVAARAVSDTSIGKYESNSSDRVRIYRASNIRELRSSRRRFKRPVGFELTHYWQESAKRFEAELYRLQATIRVSPRAMKWLINDRTKVTVLPASVQPKSKRKASQHNTSIKADWQEVLMPIESIEHGARQLLAFGGEVEVLAPSELREKVIECANEVLTRHAVG